MLKPLDADIIACLEYLEEAVEIGSAIREDDDPDGFNAMDNKVLTTFRRVLREAHYDIPEEV